MISACATHGRAGTVETCSHIAKLIHERKRPNGRRLALHWGAPLLLCDACFESLGFEQFVSLSRDSLPLEEALPLWLADGREEAF
jgi:hypothetical protein